MEETRQQRDVASATEDLFGSQTAVDADPKASVALRSAGGPAIGRPHLGMLLLRVWLCVACVFVLIGGLSLGLTAEPRTLLVVGAVSIVLGLLGSMVALLNDPSAAARTVPSR